MFNRVHTSGHGDVHLPTIIYIADMVLINIKNLPTEEGRKEGQRGQEGHEPIFNAKSECFAGKTWLKRMLKSGVIQHTEE